MAQVRTCGVPPPCPPPPPPMPPPPSSPSSRPPPMPPPSPTCMQLAPAMPCDACCMPPPGMLPAAAAACVAACWSAYDTPRRGPGMASLLPAATLAWISPSTGIACMEDMADMPSAEPVAGAFFVLAVLMMSPSSICQLTMA
ncbi:hypothetical protein GCN75_12450 [Janthinobacterium violaceinigrum]|uniref:Uncharacterized protein n=1 Tax=Janthinobacterium violaceinigrum TaxID=2654252 RepID=A0A6I1IJW5_9BURK|nr:hypothetical protein GCN75_12450 [Janthinobacterium violaceinigrum]